MNKQEDFIGAGFKRVKHFSRTPPKIKWGKLYGKKTRQEKIQYLEKLASAMNHAADMIQRERDALNELCIKKEKKINTMRQVIEQNNELLQQEVTRMNSQRQAAAEEVSRLNAEIRKLKSGNQY